MCASHIEDEEKFVINNAAKIVDLYAVVPAAGSGRRMNHKTPKQYIELNGVTILKRTINRLLQIESIKKIILVVDATAIESIDSALFTGIPNPRIEICVGGASRVESVRNGLLYLQKSIASDAQVLVHDAARPCVRTSDIYRLITEVDSDANGGLLAMPVSDTMKRANKAGRAYETVDREALWRAATPQLFAVSLLLAAIEEAIAKGSVITDEAQAMQELGYEPKLVECHADNIKITTATDLVLAQHYLLAQEAEVVSGPTDKN